MIDKIRLHHAGKLPAEYVSNLGGGFDGRCVHFLRISYRNLVDRVTSTPGASDEELLAWALRNGRHPDDDEIEVWNEFMRKRGWKDEGTPTLARRLKEIHCEDRTDIQTSFDFIELDEGRDPRDNPRDEIRFDLI
jgi:gluconokinase